jgi:hypothetical protein
MTAVTLRAGTRTVSVRLAVSSVGGDVAGVMSCTADVMPQVGGQVVGAPGWTPTPPPML